MRRDLTLGAIVRWTMIIAASVALVAQPLSDRIGYVAMCILFGVGAMWMVLSFRSARLADGGGFFHTDCCRAI